MKGSAIVAAAAAMAGGAAASRHHNRHAGAHDLFHRNDGSVCAPECTTIYSTFYGEPTLVLASPPSSAPVVPEPVSPTQPAVVAPTPTPVTVTEPGTYTVPATVITLTEPATIGAPTPTVYPPGTYTRPEVVTTITVSSTVFYCPYTSVGAPTPAPAPTTVAAQPVTEAAEPVTAAAEPPASSVAAPVVPPIVSSVAPVESSPAATTPSKGLGGGSWYAMTYTPFTSTKVSACKSASEVRSDIQALSAAGFRAVRVYSTECDTLPNVGAAVREFGMEMILGVFVKNDGCSYETPTIKTQVDDIVSWAQWDIVPLIVVGNEAHLSGKCSTEQLATLLSTVKTKAQGAGYTGPFTVAETTNIWQDASFANVICNLVDVTGGNVHPYFNTQTSAANAGSFVKGQLDILDTICTGKTSFNLECGWPTAGVCQGAACPGAAEQAAALESIVREAGSRTVFFSFQNDEWKDPGSCGCESSWGCGSLFQSSSFTARSI